MCKQIAYLKASDRFREGLGIHSAYSPHKRMCYGCFLKTNGPNASIFDFFGIV